MAKDKAKDRKPAANRKRSGTGSTGLGRDIAAVVLFAVALVLGLALVSFSAGDAPLVARGLPAASNLVGPVGHRLAAFVYRVLGFAGLVVPLALGAFAWRLFRDAPRRITVVAAAAHLVLTLSLATLAHLLLAARHLTSFPAGGAVGRALCTRAEALFSPVGAGLLVGACALVALILGFDFQLREAAAAVAGALRALALFVRGRLGDAVDRHREAVAELRAQEALARAQREEAAAEARVEAGSPDDEAEGRAVAGALALERARAAYGDDPAWVLGLSGAAEAAEPEEKPRRRRKAAAAETPAGTCDATDTRPLAAAPAEDPPAGDEPAAGAAEPLPPADKPQIVLSQAMLERGKKKKERKDEPAFAYTQSGEVFRLPVTDLLDQREVGSSRVDLQACKLEYSIVSPK